MKKLIIVLALLLVACAPTTPPPIGPTIDVKIEPLPKPDVPEVEVEPTPIYNLIPWDFDKHMVLKIPFFNPDFEEYKERLNYFQSFEFIENQSVDYPNFNYNDSDAEFNINQQYHNNLLTKDEAHQDVQQLHNILKFGFGGLFDSISANEFYDKILWMKNQIPNEGIYNEDFMRVLTVGLSFIKDPHFLFNTSNPRQIASQMVHESIFNNQLKAEDYQMKLPIYASNLKLIKDENGDYIDHENGKKVTSNLGNIFPMLDDDFNLIYTLIDYSRYGPFDNPSQIFYEDNSSKHLIFKSFNINPVPSVDHSRIKVVGDVLYLDLSGDVLQSENVDEREEMIDEALLAETIIFDIRSNIGGAEGYLKPLVNAIFDQRKDLNSEFGENYHTAFPYDSNIQTYVNPNFEEVVDGLHLIKMPSVDILPKTNQKVIILIDPYTSSAGEYLIGHFKRYPNAIMIGTNTAGAATSMVGQLYALNYSKLSLRVPIAFNAYHPNSYTSDAGYLPDIWVDQLDVEKLIDYLLK